MQDLIWQVPLGGFLATLTWIFILMIKEDNDKWKR